MFEPMKMHEARAGWRVEVFHASIWIVMGKYVLRIGRPFAGFQYAWRPLFQFFKAFR